MRTRTELCVDDLTARGYASKDFGNLLGDLEGSNSDVRPDRHQQLPRTRAEFTKSLDGFGDNASHDSAPPGMDRGNVTLVWISH